MQPFQNGYLHSFIWVSDSSPSFHGSIAHSLSALMSIPCLGAPPILATHPPKAGVAEGSVFTHTLQVTPMFTSI